MSDVCPIPSIPVTTEPRIVMGYAHPTSYRLTLPNAELAEAFVAGGRYGPLRLAPGTQAWHDGNGTVIVIPNLAGEWGVAAYYPVGGAGAGRGIRSEP